MHAEIGEAAGVVWRYLEAHDAVRLAVLKRGIKLQDPVFLMAIGWLAREGKLRFERTGRSLRVALTER